MVQPLRCTPAIPKDENGEALHMQTRPSTLRGAFRVATVASILLTVWPGSSLAAYAPTRPVLLQIATSPAIPQFLLPYMITMEIVGGTITDSYPEGITGRKWAAPTPFCTGTLISPHVFITAAHCLFSDQQLFESDNPQPYDPSLLQVVYDSQRYDVADLFVHPHFNGDSINDIALLVLVDPVSGVQPAKLARLSPRTGTRATIVGFGDSGGAVEDVGKYKREGTVRLKQCPASSAYRTSICWYTAKDGDTNSCFGDSGGPVFVEHHPGRRYLAGIISGGDNGCLAGWNNNTDVAEFRNWIVEEVERIDPIIDDDGD